MAEAVQEGFDEEVLEQDRIERKADVFIRMLEADGRKPDEIELIESHDVNGPWVSTDDAEFHLKEEVEYVLDQVDLGGTHHTILASGHPIENLRKVRGERLGKEDLGLVGELGSVYEDGGGLEFVYPEEDPRELFDVHRRLYEKAADEEVKLLPQNNVSNTVTCIRVEGEGEPGDERSGAYRVDGIREQTLEDIAGELEDYNGFEYDGDRVAFDNSLKNAAILTDVLRYEFRYPGLRFERADDGRIAFYRDPEDDPDMELDEAWDFVKDALPEGAEPVENDDWGVDVKTRGNISKGVGIHSYADEKLDEVDYAIAHVGDSETDVLEVEGAYNFPLEGTEAHEYCVENRIPHIPVENYGAEFAEIMGEVADRL